MPLAPAVLRDIRDALERDPGFRFDIQSARHAADVASIVSAACARHGVEVPACGILEHIRAMAVVDAGAVGDEQIQAVAEGLQRMPKAGSFAISVFTMAPGCVTYSRYSAHDPAAHAGTQAP